MIYKVKLCIYLKMYHFIRSLIIKISVYIEKYRKNIEKTSNYRN